MTRGAGDDRVSRATQDAENAVVDARLATRALICDTEPVLHALQVQLGVATALLDRLAHFAGEDVDHHG